MSAEAESPSLVDAIFAVDEGDEALVATSTNSWASPMTVDAVDEAVIWEVPFGDDWRERTIAFSGTGGAGYYVDVIDCVDEAPRVDAHSGYDAGELTEFEVLDAGDEAEAETAPDDKRFEDADTPDWLDEGSWNAAIQMADDVDGLVQVLGWTDRKSIEALVEELGVGDRLGGDSADA